MLDAVPVAAAEDVLEAFPASLATAVAERGQLFGATSASGWSWPGPWSPPRNPGPGGVNSAVDAHTEARIADRLDVERQGHATVVCTTSQLLDRADRVRRWSTAASSPRPATASCWTPSRATAAVVTGGEES
jgi:hypothetical protein